MCGLVRVCLRHTSDHSLNSTAEYRCTLTFLPPARAPRCCVRLSKQGVPWSSVRPSPSRSPVASRQRPNSSRFVFSSVPFNFVLSSYHITLTPASNALHALYLKQPPAVPLGASLIPTETCVRLDSSSDDKRACFWSVRRGRDGLFHGHCFHCDRAATHHSSDNRSQCRSRRPHHHVRDGVLHRSYTNNGRARYESSH